MLLVSTQARGVLIKLSSREVVQVGQKARWAVTQDQLSVLARDNRITS